MRLLHGVTKRALQSRSKPAPSSRFGLSPFSELPRWVMPDMLRVAAVELGDPLSFVIAMEPGDSSQHCRISVKYCSNRDVHALLEVLEISDDRERHHHQQ